MKNGSETLQTVSNSDRILAMFAFFQLLLNSVNCNNNKMFCVQDSEHPYFPTQAKYKSSNYEGKQSVLLSIIMQLPLHPKSRLPFIILYYQL